AIGAPSDTVLAYLFSQDAQFLQGLVSQKALTPNQIAMLAQGNMGVLTKIDKATGLPFWKTYATSQDIARVSSKAANAQNAAMQAGGQALQDQNVKALNNWYQAMSGLIQQKVGLEESYAVVDAMVGRQGYQLDPRQLRGAALRISQGFDNVNTQVQSVLKAI